MSNNNSIAYRRELRKKKILENAELRKQKIFGLNTLTENDVDVQDKFNDLKRPALRTSLEQNIGIPDEQDETSSTKDETSSTKSFESQRSSKSQHQDDESVFSPKDIHMVNDILRNIPDPISEYQYERLLYNSSNVLQETVSPFQGEENEPPPTNCTSNINSSSDFTSSASPSLHSRNGSNLLSNSNDRLFINSNPCLLFDILGHPVSPSFLAIVVCLLIYIDMGNLVSNSLIIPFCIWEIQQLIASYSSLEAKEESTSLLDAVLVLCGIQRNIIIKYIWFSKLLRDIFIDFSIYFVILVAWQLVIGFPASVIPV